MNSGLEYAATKRRRTYDHLATSSSPTMYSSANTSANTIDKVDLDEVMCDSHQYPEILLQRLLGQFETELSLARRHMSQQQIRIQRETSTKILNYIQKFLLKPTLQCNVTDTDYESRGYKEIKVALELLVDCWGLGDIQIYNVLVDTLLRSYMMVQKGGNNVLLQEFILLDLLPCATGGDSEKCLLLQSEVAKALARILTNHGRNCGVYHPIICWCKWYLNFYQYQEPYGILSNEASSNDVTTASLPISPEIYRLGLGLLRKVPSVDLLPSVLSINLDLFTSCITFEYSETLSLQQHSKDLVVAMRQRWTELIFPRDLRQSKHTTMNEAERIVACKRQLLNLFVIAILDKDINQEHFLTDAYCEVLLSASNGNRDILKEHLLSGTENNQITKKRSNCDSAFTDSCDVTVEASILTIDWIFVITLFSSTTYQNLAIAIVDTWVLGKAYDSLFDVIRIVFVNSEVSELPLQVPNNILDTINYKYLEQRLVPCLLKMAYVLILKPQRDYLCWHESRLLAGRLMQFDTEEQTFQNRFIINMLLHLDVHRQKELLSMLLRVTDEILFFNQQRFDRLRININVEEACKAKTAASTIVRSVFTIMEEVAQVTPLKIHLKNALIEYINLPGHVDDSSLSNTNVDRRICTLLVSLMTPNPTNDTFGNENGFTQSGALFVLQKLLFAEVSHHGKATRAIRGILLATELMSVKCCTIMSIDERKLIHEWVMRLLLPGTRRMVEPELGLAGLKYLNGCIDSHFDEKVNMKESLFFQHIKMMVANTGLVQVLDKYRVTLAVKLHKEVSQVNLAYSSSVIESKPENTDQESPRSFFFGINFFLRRSTETILDPSRWFSIADWIFELMDTYLQIGRTRVSKSWNPLGWLRAPLEFPTIDASFFNPSNQSQRLIIEFLDQNLCQFELSKGIQHHNSFPASYADIVVCRLYSKKLKLFVDSLRIYAIALLIGIFLSSAVLKNAYEHAEGADRTSSGVQNFIIEQIIKIYDLRAKSTTMDSIFSSIESALRRSWLRKKRAKVVLSDDSSENGNSPALVLTQKNQDIDILDDFGHILKESRNLRDIVFASTKYVGNHVLWSALKVIHESESIPKGLESLICITEDKLLLESCLKLSGTIGTKLHIIQQILKQFESSSRFAYDSTKSNIQYCFVEVSFFIPWLAKLRKRCAEVKTTRNDRIFSHMEESLALMVRVTSSYLQVIAIFLQRLHHYSHFFTDGNTFNSPARSLDEHFIHFDAVKLNTGEVDVTIATSLRLFTYFADHLGSAEYAEIADNILEILSIIATFDDALSVQLFDLSWVHLQTVYVHTIANIRSEPLCCPFAVAFCIDGLKGPLLSLDQQSNARIVKGILQKLLQIVNCYDSNSLYWHFGMIRHWGILIAFGDVGLPVLLLNLTTLVTNLNTLLKSVNLAVSRKAESHKAETHCARKQKSCEVPHAIGLETATFPEFFETLFYLVIATTGLVTSGQQRSNLPTNMYQMAFECVAIFRTLIETYKDHVDLFPGKSALTICYGSKDILLFAFRHLQRCAEYRMDPSLLSNSEESIGVRDVKNARVLKEITDRMLSYTAVPLLSICDLWETSTIAIKKSKILSLRLAVARTTRLIKDVSHSHNISDLSLIMENDKIEVRHPNKRFHMYPDTYNTTIREQSSVVPLDDFDATDNKIQDNKTTEIENVYDGGDGGDNDSSFEVLGNWGDVSNDDDASDSICSLNIENPVSNLFPQKL